MRTYGREYALDGTYKWVEITTDEYGFDDAVQLTTLAQCLQLHLGESPFFASFGIPQYRSVVKQVWPDFYVTQTQIQFAPYFVSLGIQNIGGANPNYNVNVTLHSGAQVTKTFNAEFPT